MVGVHGGISLDVESRSLVFQVCVGGSRLGVVGGGWRWLEVVGGGRSCTAGARGEIPQS